MNRRFQAGQTFTVDGYDFRVVAGYKASDDLRLDMRTARGWDAVPMSIVLLMTDFLTENEDVLYPPDSPSRNGGKNLGGEKLMRALRKAKNHGWVAANNELEYEKRAKRLFDGSAA